MRRPFSVVLVAMFAMAGISAGCQPTAGTKTGQGVSSAARETRQGETSATVKASQDIKCDGSSTVYLITEAIATHFKNVEPNVPISIGISGTGGGFKKFAAGEMDINNASRQIRPAEIEQCRNNGVEYLELQIAWDGLTVVIHPQNTWAKQMTADQLRRIWHPDIAAKKWSDVDSQWPEKEIRLFGPGPDSGTFDFFTAAINGEEKLSRKDYQASEDDNTTAQGVAGDQFALGYFGLAYFEENRDKLAAVAIAAKPDEEYVLPRPITVLDKTYRPLSRPLFIYVSTKSLQRPEMEKFVRFYLRRADLVTAAKFIPLTDRQLLETQDEFEAAIKTVK